MTAIELLALLTKQGITLSVDGGDLRISAPKGSLTEELRAHLVANKSELLEILTTDSATTADSHKLSHIDRNNTNKLPLSFAQERLWFLDQLETGSSLYNIPTALRLHGKPNVQALEKALSQLVQRHETLRTTFSTEGREPVIQITANSELKIQLHQSDASEYTLLTKLCNEPFDLTTGPLFKAHLLRINEQEHILLIVVHHIVADGWSLGILMRELAVLYAAEVNDTTPVLPSLSVQYADFAAWQRQRLKGAELEKHLGYWRKQLTGIPAVLEIPTDRPRPATPSNQGAWASEIFPPELLKQLEQLALNRGNTLYMVLLAAFNVLLYRYTRQEDLLVGTPVAGRQLTETEGLVGLFVNSVIIRSQLSDDLSFAALLQQTAETSLDALSHQDLPFEKLVEELQPDRDASYAPLFQVMFNMQSREQEQVPFEGLKVSPVIAEPGTAKFDLNVLMEDREDGLATWFEYSTDLFDESTIVRMLQHFHKLLEAIVANPEAQLADFPLLTSTEQAQLLHEWNATNTDFPADKTLINLFEVQVTRTPDAIALVFQDEALSYRELNTSINQLAHHLRKTGIGPESLVGVFMERSFEMVIALYGILKAGGAYVPLDPEYPSQRLKHMLEDAGIELLLSQTHLAKQLPDHNAQVINLDEGAEATIIGQYPTSNPQSVNKTEHAAYVIFTSGSTGRPKGVLNEHRGICNRLQWMQREYGLDKTDHVLQKTPFSFDVSVWEFFWPLQTGARLVIAEPEGHRDSAYLCKLINEQQITTLHFVPSMLASFLQDATTEKCSSLRRVICSGEALSTDLQQQFYANLQAELHNLYGPTEAAIDVTSWACSANDSSATVPIGRPIANTQIYIVDSRNQLAPIGIPGELLIGGIQVARGYVNQPELTHERFIANPFSEDPEDRVYRTGDLARLRADGVIEFLGRIDFQVKLRGFRIELGEIEAELQNCEGVKQSAVLLREDTPGDQRIVAYLVGSFDVDTVRIGLKAALPDYMLPAAFITVDALPLTPNGKLDRNALPVPDWSASNETDYVAPRTPIEEALTEMWQSLLGIEKIGVHDDFFQLGGHSLLATRLVARIRDTLNRELPLKSLFDAPSIAGLAEALDNSDAVKRLPLSTRPDPATAPLSASQQRLWILDQMEPGNPVYNIPWAMRLTGLLHTTALQAAIDALTLRHESLRTHFIIANGTPVQSIQTDTHIQLHTRKLPGATTEQISAELTKLTQQHFDLARGPLLNVNLLHINDSEHVLQIVMHHIIGDAWSTDILLRELAVLYNAELEQKPAALPDLPIQFADYAAWQQQRLQEPVMGETLAYWKEQLAAAPAVLDLPTDRPRPAVQTHNGAWHGLHLSAELTTALKSLANTHNATLYMVLLAAFNVLLGRYSGQNDIVVGSPIAGRQQTELENLIGFFINTLVLRTNLDGSPRFTELLEQLKTTALEAYAHQELPFEQLVEELQPVRDTSYAPLFQVMFILQNAPASQTPFTGLDTAPMLFEFGTAKLDLTLSMEESDGELIAYFEYNTDLFDADTIERMGGHLQHLLTQITTHPDASITDFDLLSQRERAQLLETWNETEADYPRDASLHSLIELQARANSNAIAIISDEHQLSYSELDAAANKLAHRLIELGAGKDIPIALCVDRSPDMLVALLGILKAGSAYVPLDPDFPPDRLRYMLEDSAAPIIVTETNKTALVEGLDILVICLDQPDPITSRPDTSPAISVAPDQLAYIIYTSGSTGKPKGVAIEHRAAINFLTSMLNKPGLNEKDRLLAVTTLSFDISILEIFGPLLTAATVVLANKTTTADGFALARILTQQNITVMQATPATWRMLLQTGWQGSPGLKILCGGEALDPGLAQQLTACGTALWNMYGPTETTIWSACAQIHNDTSYISVGRPIANTQCYILDAQHNPVPLGVAGELFIGGDGVAREYLNRPELTAEKFIADPFISNNRMYSTGDLARYHTDGSIEVLGRTDFQVKLRGFRIELGEIEAALTTLDSVAQCVTVLREDTPGDQRLVAYVTSEGKPPDDEALRSHLHANLPNYMVPAAFMRLDSFPLTPNGKVNRKQLPAPEWQAEAEYIAPRNELEESLCHIWAEVLDLEKVGIYDDFFALGGHSLLATRLISRILDTLEIELPLMSLFNHRSVATLAVELSDRKQQKNIGQIQQLPRDGKLPLSFAQQRLWFLDELSPGDPMYNVPWVMRLDGKLNHRALENALNQVIARHESLRTVFTNQDGEALQIILPEIKLSIPEIDLRNTDASVVQERITELAQQRMNLSEGPLLYVTLLRVENKGWLLSLIVHHIIFDAWSHGIFLRELSDFYNAELNKQTLTLPNLTIEFADYAGWQRNWFGSEDFNQQLTYWKNKLADAPGTLDLPTDHPRPPVQTSNGANISRMLSKDLHDDVHALLKQEGASLFMVLLATFNLLMSRYSGQDDLLVGTPISGRKRTELEKIVGFFLHTLVIRADLSGNPSFRELLARTKQTVLEAFAHQEMPFETLVEELDPERDTSRHPLFQVHFVLQHVDIDWQMFDGVTASPFEFEFGTAKFDIMFFVFDTNDSLSVRLEYNTDLFEADTVERMIDHFETLLTGIIANPDQSCGELPILPEAEKHQLLVEWNQTDFDYPASNTMHGMFEQQATHQPNAIALLTDDVEYSYRELNRRANKLAIELQQHGVGPEVLVAMCSERCAELIIGLLAIQKAGGAYVPVDPEYPPQRVAHMLSDSEAPVLLTQTGVLERLPEHSAKVICLDKFDWKTDESLDINPTSGVTDENLSYTIYTSGSTGLPKGVEIEHRNAVAMIEWAGQAFQPEEFSGVLASTSICFDLSIFEIFCPLGLGGRIILVKDALALPELPPEANISLINTVPSAMAELVRIKGVPASVKTVNLAGEPLSTALVNSIYELDGIERVNDLYGPSEDTTYSTWTLREANALPTIGRPLLNTQAYLLDAYGQPVPIGVAGELYLGGAGVTRGYRHRPELTAERYVPNPFNDEPGTRMYRTGDQARYRTDGNLEFLGRLDHQVKLRGFRIELGEIETALASHSAVENTVVMAREDREGDKRLVAYIVASTEGLEGDELEQWEAEQVNQWQDLWQDAYSRESETEDLALDFKGWNSSYSGDAIPQAEMREWLDNTRANILALKPDKALEIGSGTGLVVGQIAPTCSSYTATDFSAASIDALKHLKASHDDLDSLQLKQCTADQISEFATAEFDTIILNSVAQYFPDIDYLLQFIRAAVDKVNDNGHIYLGDLRSMPLLSAYHASVQFFQADAEIKLPELAELIRQRTEQEEELLIDPAFFVALKNTLPVITGIRFQLKQSRYQNELTRFRYDVTLEVGGTIIDRDGAEHLDWTAAGLDAKKIEQQMQNIPATGMLITAIPDARLQSEVRVLAETEHADRDSGTVAKLRTTIEQQPSGIEPELIYELGKKYGIDVQLSGTLPGQFCVFLRSGNQLGFDGELMQAARPVPWRDYGNDPLQGRLQRSLIPILRDRLRVAVPDYMMPSAFVILDAFPLTPNGKINRKALPAPERKRGEQEVYVAPRTNTEEQLVAIWSDVLGVKQIGVHDDFFALGGHSLLATQLISRIRDGLNTELPLMALFNHPTVAGLALEITGDAAAVASAVIQPCDRTNQLPLSFAQQRLWFLDQLEGISATYNVPLALALHGTLNQEAMQAAIDALVERHESLRTSFTTSHGKPAQLIHASVAIPLDIVDMANATEDEVQQHLEELAQTPFNLSCDALVRVHLLQSDTSNHRLLLVMHHIVSDGWSLGILARELAALYAQHCGGETAALKNLPVQYADYAVWQRCWLAGEELQRQLSYWGEQLDNAPALLQIPTDHPRQPTQTFNGAHINRTFTPELGEQLRDLAAAEDCTLFMALLAAFNVLLQRYTNSDDIVIGTPIAGRTRTEIEGLIGFFVNTLAIRTDLSGEPRFVDVMQRVKRTAMDAYGHQDLPFEKLVEELQPDRDTSHPPIFQVLFVVQENLSEQIAFHNMDVTPLDFELGSAKFDLSLFMVEFPEGLTASFEYNTDLFDAATIERMLDQLETLLKGITNDAEKPITELPLLHESEREHVLNDFNTTQVSMQDISVHSLVEAQATKTPVESAISFGSEELSYAELNTRANRLARHLYEKGAGPGSLVGICANRSLNTAVAVLATLKAGAAYVPIDPKYPSDRVAYMLEDSRAPVLLTHSDIVPLLPEHNAHTICLDTFDWTQGNDSNLQDIHGESVYVIYTSGSTGQPKGVELTHAGLSNLIQWQNTQPSLNVAARTLQFASLSFDVSFQELFTTWAQGGTVVLVNEELRRDLPALAKFIATDEIERVYLPFAALQPLADSIANTRNLTYAVKDVIIAGEQLQITPPIRKMFTVLGDARLHNQYGPSETHVVTAYTLKGTPDTWMPLPPIGKPVANTRVYVLDSQQQPVPVGVPGELFLGGPQVAKGYIHKRQLSAEKFIRDPFRNDTSARMYRTGDRVRFLTDGNLEYLGRTDDQVKWRGFRIEPGEIETALTEHPDVHQAAILLREDTPGDKRLAAYLIASDTQTIDINAIRTWLKTRVPDYMMPSAFMILKKMPLTPSGKVARRKLPVPDYTEVAQLYVAPRTPAEEALVQIWSDVLNVPQIGIHDDFFTLGGHSLLATQLVSRVRDALNVELQLITLFNHPSVAEFAAEVAAANGEITISNIKPCDRSQPLPLSFAQQRLWFLDQLEPGNPVYNVPWAMRLDGPLNIQALQASIDDLVTRHETLRTLFSVTMGKPQQCVLEQTAVPVESVDATGDTEAQLEQRLRSLARIPFGLGQTPLMRVHVLHVANDQHIILLVLHHIISDGWSLSVLYQELVQLYAGHCQNNTVNLPALPVHYADYSVWQHDWFRGAGQQEQLNYWSERLRGAPAILELPTDRPRGAAQTYNGAFIERVLPEHIHTGLKDITQQEKATLFMTCLTAFNVLLARYSGQTDICVGTPVAGRRHTELEGLIGFFINTLVMRNDLSGQPSFAEAIARIKQTALEAYAHQELPFEKLVDKLHPTRDMSHAPLFQVAFILQNTPWDQSATLHDLEISPIELDYGVSKFDLSLVMAERREGLLVHFEYNTDLYNRETIDHMVGHFETLLEAIVQDQQQPISSLPLLTEAENQQILYDWNATDVPYADTSCIHTLIEERTEAQPTAPAILYLNECISFAELNQRANQIANYLISEGAGPGVIVGLCLERSPDLVAALLGVFKSGAAYVPLDPKYPSNRLEWMLTDSQAPLLITHSLLKDSLPPSNAKAVCIDNDWPEISQQPTSNPACKTTAEDIAWVIYTSGSTGKPKGVMIKHQGACNLAEAQVNTFKLGPDDRMLQFASVSFDASIFELIMGLQVGAAMVLAPQDDLMPGEPLLDVLKRHAVTAVTLPPTALMALPAAQLPALKTITVAGEACPPELVENWADNRRFFNLYGPTEATVWASYAQCFPGEPVTIGKPITNARLYVLDEYLQALPIGVPGELCIGGAGLAQGYLNRAELSAEKFLPDPFHDDPDARIYRSGDRVRLLADGNIEFLGRIDHQLKVRGFRIEAGEIEATLTEMDAVHDAVVIARGEAIGSQQLVAYLVVQDNAELSLNELRIRLQQSLPEFMIPAAFVVLDEFPLTPNGKIDHAALPAPEEEQRLTTETTYVAPQTPAEKVLSSVWQQLLNLKKVGIHDNFFELGGDSILSIQIIARAAQQGLHLTPKQIFQHQTIAELATAAGSASADVISEQGDISGPVPLTPIQTWFVKRGLQKPQHFNQSMLLKTETRLDCDALETALQTLVKHHDALRLRLEQVNGNWQQEITPQNVDDLHHEVDLSGLDTNAQNETMERLASAMQASFDLSEGPLLRAALFRLGESRPDHIVIAIHHIAVDWVSWAILLEDLDTAYRAASNKTEAQLPLKTSSFKAWAEALAEYANSDDMLSEVPYWRDQQWDTVDTLPVDHPEGENSVAATHDVTLSLTKDETRLLLQELPRSWRAQANDVLLSGLVRALKDWTGSNSALINLEGHGREELFNSLNISRTVGWFTSLYPVLLHIDTDMQPGETLQTIKEQLGKIPNRGLGFGLLRHLNRDTSTQQILQAIPEPSIGFNYLGQIDQVANHNALLQPATGPRGLEQGPADPRPHLLDIHSAVSDEQLQLSVIYSNKLWDKTSIEKFAQLYIAQLRELISACTAAGESTYTPIDFPLANINQTQLDSLLTEQEPIEDIYRVTSLQHGMLFHSLFTAENDVYFARFRWRLSGELNTEAFSNAWQDVINRHASLRTSFHWEGFNQPVQVVHKDMPIDMHTEDWSSLDEKAQAKKLSTFLQADELKQFDFTSAPLMRITLIKLGDNDHHFIWSFHHAIVDGWSVPLVLKEVFACYHAHLAGIETALPKPQAFSEYIHWLDQQDKVAAESFWRNTLAGFTAPTPLPAALHQHAETGTQAEFAELSAQISAETIDRLRDLAQQSHLTLNTIVQGAWALLLSRYSGEEDIVFGATTSGRPATMPGVESMIGLFLNTLPVRVTVDAESSVLDWLQTLQTSQLDVRQFEHASLVEIQGWSNVPRGTPMFESLLAFENYPEMETMWTNTESVTIREVDGFDRTNFPLTVNVAVFDLLHMRIAYDTRLFTSKHIQELITHLTTLLENIAGNADCRVHELTLLSEQEQQQIANWNDTTQDYPQDATLVSLFETQVSYNGNAIAVSYAGESLTYSELNAQANQLANYLRSKGVGPDTPVGVCVDRSLELVITLLGILKAGGAYVPLDPEYPQQRLTYMLEDADISLLVTQSKLHSSFPDYDIDVFLIDEDWDKLSNEATNNPEQNAGPNNLAYIIFTSGSTGRPKGVLNEHHGIVNRLLWMQEEYKLDATDAVLQKTPFSFDVSVWEFFWPLTTGARLVMAKPGGHRDSGYLIKEIISEKITTMHFVPPMLQVFLQDTTATNCTSLKRVICSGEALSMELQQHFFAMLPAELHNLYGPTEAAIDVSYWACERDTKETAVPIGAPVTNTQLHIVDKYGHPCAIGLPGELWIGGDQVARGYINRPELTAAAFITDPFSGKPDARIYKTGDLVRWRADGNIEFLGRIDHQIKLRGFRIELGEIESHLVQLDKVQQAVVLLREDTPGLKQLIAYVECTEPAEFEQENARSILNKHLPDYMVPTAFVALQTFPLTANGKLDRKALPAPEMQENETAYIAPRNEIEQQLAAMWSELLGIDQVGIEDDFFALGGHSLVAMQVVSQIMQAMGVQLPLEVLFDAPTIASLAESVNKSTNDKADTSVIKRISRTQRRARRKHDDAE
ncbi:MAG: amino acid adenylation domain-containing protein [Gammaproteobacteria bacterium]|nr:amino acid adenylation domain-containing protein [Gammaproteobacteria bacterium]